MKEKILELRQQGKTYTDIQNILGCSRGTISYHCGPGQKEKSKLRQKKNRRSVESIVKRKVDLFLSRTKDFRLKYLKRGEEHNLMVNKIISNPICYLTGTLIDLSKPNTYSLDHIIPFYISEDNSVNNLGLTTKNANASKAHLTVDEYINLCKKVIKYNESVV